MKALTIIRRIERADQLIRLKATGTPKEFAKRLNISESSLYELLIVMKDLEAPILYCSNRKSYYYDRKVRFQFGFQISSQELASTKGGFGSFSDFFSSLQSYRSESPFLCNTQYLNQRGC